MDRNIFRELWLIEQIYQWQPRLRLLLTRCVRLQIDLGCVAKRLANQDNADTHVGFEYGADPLMGFVNGVFNLTVKFKLSVCALTCALFSSVTFSGHASELAPRVIGGQQGHPLSSMSVYIEILSSDSSCTAGLWKPQILVTAAHCFGDTNEDSVYDSSLVLVYPPGANIEAGPANVLVTNIFVDPKWDEDSDIAFLTLDQPLGETPITRLATSKEVKRMALSGVNVLYIGYGLTSARDNPEAEGSPIPLWLESPLVEYPDEPDSLFHTQGNGVTSTCAGDSGGPYAVVQDGEVLLLGPLSGGSGPPCESELDDPSLDDGVVAASFGKLSSQALAVVGESLVKPEACVNWGDDQECFSERSWVADICSEKRRVSLLEKTVGGWKKVKTVRGKKKVRDCSKNTPYLISYQARSAPGSYSYAFKFGRNDLERFSVVVK